jgi:hypothetical protein
MTDESRHDDVVEKRLARRLMWIAVASALFWLLHSFAVRSLPLAVRHSASKLGH